MTFDPTKPVQTADGQPARIICTDARKTTHSIVTLVDCGGAEIVVRHNHLGECADAGRAHLNLVNVPEKGEQWVAVYKNNNDGSFGFDNFETKEKALRSAFSVGSTFRLIAVKRLEFTSGEGLETKASA